MASALALEEDHPARRGEWLAVVLLGLACAAFWLTHYHYSFVPNADYFSFDRAARDVLKRALGEDAVFEKLPNDHRLYHCYFDFEGPPAGDDVVSTWDRPAGSKTIYEFMEAIFLDGRMIVLFSNKSLNNAWNADIHWRQGGNTRQIQFGVNIVVYVLTQPGGYTQQAARYR